LAALPFSAVERTEREDLTDRLPTDLLDLREDLEQTLIRSSSSPTASPFSHEGQVRTTFHPDPKTRFFAT
jgi:hypothetical protein